MKLPEGRAVANVAPDPSRPGHDNLHRPILCEDAYNRAHDLRSLTALPTNDRDAVAGRRNLQNNVILYFCTKISTKIQQPLILQISDMN